MPLSVTSLVVVADRLHSTCVRTYGSGWTWVGSCVIYRCRRCGLRRPIALTCNTHLEGDKLVVHVVLLRGVILAIWTRSIPWNICQYDRNRISHVSTSDIGTHSSCLAEYPCRDCRWRLVYMGYLQVIHKIICFLFIGDFCQSLLFQALD